MFGNQIAKSFVITIWILDTHTVPYSDESSIQLFGIQMVTVLGLFVIWLNIRPNFLFIWSSGYGLMDKLNLSLLSKSLE